MYICYVDESGGFEAPNTAPNATPLMAFAGLIIRTDQLGPLTVDFLRLKERFITESVTEYLDYVLLEIKGSDLRSGVRSGSRRKQRYALGVLDGVTSLVDKYRLRLVGRIWIKEAYEGLKPRESYTFSIQNIANHFNRFLQGHDAQGIMLCDGRRPHLDSQVAHSVFTQKHKLSGDAMSHIIETPVFGRSQNHVGLQMADIIVSGLLFPIAARVYCAEGSTSVHSDPSFEILRFRYSGHLNSMQYAYKQANRRREGVVVSDKLNKKSSKLLFRPPEPWLGPGGAG